MSSWFVSCEKRCDARYYQYYAKAQSGFHGAGRILFLAKESAISYQVQIATQGEVRQLLGPHVNATTDREGKAVWTYEIREFVQGGNISYEMTDHGGAVNIRCISTLRAPFEIGDTHPRNVDNLMSTAVCLLSRHPGLLLLMRPLQRLAALLTAKSRPLPKGKSVILLLDEENKVADVAPPSEPHG